MHKAETMLLVITEEAIIMIIPFFVQVTGFGLPSKLCLTFDGTVCKVFLSLCYCLPLSYFSSLPFNPPPRRPPTPIDPQQYIFALLSISHSAAGDRGAQSLCVRRGVQLQQNSPGSEGKTFLSCSMTSWSCSTVSCSCSISSPDTQKDAHGRLHLYEWEEKMYGVTFNVSSPHRALAALCWPAASVSVVSLLAGSPWWPPPETGEDRVDGSDPLASESSLGCF